MVTLWSCGWACGGEDGSRLVVDGQRAKGYVAYLSTDEMQGRASCTEGYRKAADWVAARFQEWGLKPAGEEGTYFQKVSIRGFDWNTGTPALKVAGREFLPDDDDYSVLAQQSTPGTTQQGEIVFVGYGISAPAKGLDEYGAVDVKGKIVLVFGGNPKDAPRPRRMFQRQADTAEEKKEEDPWKEESTDLNKIKTAYEKGAAAVMIYDPEESSDGGARRGRPSRGPEADAFKPQRSFLCFTINDRVFRAVMKQNPQESPQGLKRRTDSIRREIKQKKTQSRTTGVPAVLKGYDGSVRYDEEHGNNLARNVLGKIEGTDPDLKNQYVFVGAHLDHIGIRNGYVYNGADDNASGSAIVLEVARVLAQADFKPKRTLVFCCWCGEERGLLGSIHYTNQPCDGVTMDHVVACFNADMVGMGESLGASGALNFPTIWDVIKSDQDPEILKRVEPSVGGTGGSDHTGFIRRGIETLFVMSRDGVGHQDYHQPEDDTEKIEPEMMRITAQFVLQGMVNVANETQTNLLIEQRQQIYRAIQMRISNVNPALSGSSWSQVDVKPKSKEALYNEIHERARALFRGEQPSGDSSGGSGTGSQTQRTQRSLTRGLVGLELIGADIALLKLAVDFYGAGRLDIKGDDGVCVIDGRLTDDGKTALRALEELDVLVRLVSPKQNLIDDVLSAGSKPFVITGDYEIPETMVDRVNSRGVLLGIDLDPKKVDDFITRLEKTKSLLDERGNLFAFLTATEGLEEAKRPLYLGLIAKGWTHNEICGTRGRRGLLSGGSLTTLGGRAERSR